MPPAAAEGTGHCCAGWQKAHEADKKTKANAGAGMVFRRKTTSVVALLIIDNKRATNRGRKCISELSANTSRALRRDSRIHYISNQETGHKAYSVSDTAAFGYWVQLRVTLVCIQKQHYENVSVLIKFSKKKIAFTVFIISSP